MTDKNLQSARSLATTQKKTQTKQSKQTNSNDSEEKSRKRAELNTIYQIMFQNRLRANEVEQYLKTGRISKKYRSKKD